MQPDFDDFFRRYTEAFNRSLGDTVDADGIRASFTECFVSAGPQGVMCGRNDQSFTDTLQKGYEFYKSIGTRRMALRSVDVTPIDAQHHMARVFYSAGYEKTTGESVTIDFDVTYMLHTRDGVSKIFAFVAGDEMGLYKKYGLVE